MASGEIHLRCTWDEKRLLLPEPKFEHLSINRPFHEHYSLPDAPTREDIAWLTETLLPWLPTLLQGVVELIATYTLEHRGRLY